MVESTILFNQANSLALFVQNGSVLKPDLWHQTTRLRRLLLVDKCNFSDYACYSCNAQQQSPTMFYCFTLNLASVCHGFLDDCCYYVLLFLNIIPCWYYTSDGAVLFCFHQKMETYHLT